MKLMVRTLAAAAVCSSVYGRPMSADPKAIARLVGDAFLKESSPPATAGLATAGLDTGTAVWAGLAFGAWHGHTAITPSHPINLALAVAGYGGTFLGMLVTY